MSTVTRKHCDHCNAEREVAATGHWYHVYRNNPRNFRDVGDADAYDFCSLPCLASWVASRELTMGLDEFGRLVRS